MRGEQDFDDVKRYAVPIHWTKAITWIFQKLISKNGRPIKDFTLVEHSKTKTTERVYHFFRSYGSISAGSK